MQGYESYKAPTAVLTEKGARGKFVKFGFDAEETYVTLKENGEASDHELYYDFKMILYHEKVKTLGSYKKKKQSR